MDVFPLYKPHLPSVKASGQKFQNKKGLQGVFL